MAILYVGTGRFYSFPPACKAKLYERAKGTFPVVIEIAEVYAHREIFSSLFAPSAIMAELGARETMEHNLKIKMEKETLS